MGTKVTFLLLLMISLPVIFEGQFLLNIWLGSPPAHAAKLVALVLISINISSFTYFQYQGVHASGKILGQQIWISSLYVLNVAIIYLVFKLGANFDTALYVNMGIGFFQCGVNLYYARKCYGYGIKSFLKCILLPCIGVIAVIVLCLLFVIFLIPPSTGRFFLVFGVSEFLIVMLGYSLLFDKVEKAQVKSIISKFLHRGR